MKKLFTAVIFLFFSVTANAGVVLQPAGATTTAGEYGDQWVAVNAINQSGLSAGYTSGLTDFDTYIGSAPTHSVQSGNTWFSAIGVTTGFFDLDLGGTHTIQSLALWNESQTQGELQGVNAFDLYGDVNADFSTAVFLGSFNATDGLTVAEVFEFVPTTMAYLRIDILSNHGASCCVGIMEIALETGDALLGVNSGAGGQFLATIDTDTAALTNLGPTGLTIDGIAMGNGVLYAADNGNDQLVTLDPATGAVDTVLGSYVNAGTIEAMAYRKSDDTLFGIDLTNANLVSFDTSSGEATVIGPLGTGENLAGMSFSMDGTLYSIAHTSGSLFTVDPDTGAATLVATGPGTGPLGLAINPVTDVMYSATYTGGTDGVLETVDPVTAVRTAVGSMVGGLQIEGLTFRSGAVVEAVADLTISKSDSVDPVTAGTELVYTIRVDNIGLAAADDVVVTDTLPAGVTLVSTSGCTEDPAAVPSCSLGTIDAGGFAEYTVTVMVDPSTLGLITNNVSVTTSTPESDTENNSAAEVTLVNAEADLSITKMDSSDPVISGGNQELVYTLEVSNAGPSDATNVVVTDILSELAIFQSTSGCLNDPLGVPECLLGTIAAGSSASYTITILLQRSGGAIANTASVMSDASDPTGDNDSVVEITEVTPIAIPTLSNLGLLLMMLLLAGFGWVSIRRTS
jgi:uncharacterized repeat protein (TIGR01451 family)